MMDNNAKLRPIYLLTILREKSDENHPLSTEQLRKILKEQYNLEAHRTTVKSDVEMLQSIGFEIEIRRAKQNLYHYAGREFDTAELKLLIDAVESSKFITKAKSDKLVSKLSELAGEHKAQELKRNLIVNGRIKQDEERIYDIVDAINEAINAKKKIRFQMTEYNIRKQRILHNKGEKYIFSPYSLVWDGDYYYVVGFSEKYQSIGSHRVDRISDVPEILDEPNVRMKRGFDINRYINSMFHMYNAPRKEVELICDNSMMDAIIDRFGIDVPTYAWTMDSFRVITEIAVGTSFYNWVFGFQGKVTIRGPEDVKKEYAGMVRCAYANLEKSQIESGTQTKEPASTNRPYNNDEGNNL